jgi:hypothetical protein
MNGKRKKLNGFSLGEVLLSVSVLTVGVLPVMAAMTKGFQSSLASRDVIVASGLAQEGAELVKNVKDNNVLAGSASLSAWLPSSGSTWNDCRIDAGDQVLSPGNRISCGLSASAFKLSMQSSNFLGHGGAGVATKFSRKILLDYGGSGNERVTCISAVYWGQSYTPSSIADARANCKVSKKCVYAESVLTPWGS